MKNSWVGKILAKDDLIMGIALVEAIEPYDKKMYSNIAELIDFCTSSSCNILYFHDADVEYTYILNQLNKLGYIEVPELKSQYTENKELVYRVLRSDKGVFYDIELQKLRWTVDKNNKPKKNILSRCIIRSSKNILMCELDDLKKTFNINYNFRVNTRCNNVGWFDNYNLEVYSILLMLAKCVETVEQYGLTGPTIGNNAVSYWLRCNQLAKKMLSVIPSDWQDNMRLAYRGGVLYLDKSAENKEFGHGYILDMNSLYPYVMKKYPLPFGNVEHYYVCSEYELNSYAENGYDIRTYISEEKLYELCPKDFEGIYRKKVFICRCYVNGTIQNNKMACIQDTESSFKSQTLREVDDELWLSCYDLDLVINNYNPILKIKEAYVINCYSGQFDEYIDHWYTIKKTSDGALRLLSKLMQNSLYGRFGITEYKYRSAISYTSDGIRYERIKEESVHSSKTAYLPLSLFITSIARKIMIEYAEDVGIENVKYMDTDSLHIICEQLPKFNKLRIGKELGQFKIEHEFNKIKYLGLKNYALKDTETGDVIKASGILSDALKSVKYEDFNRGYEVTDGCCKVIRTARGAYRLYKKTPVIGGFNN